jgi:putative ABC transport system permease protein
MSAQWKKAPLALRHHPSVLVAVAVAALLVALAASSSPFVTTAVASEALKNRLDELTPLGTGLEITSPTFVVGHGSDDRPTLVPADPGAAAVRSLAKRLPHVGGLITTIEAGPVEIASSQGDQSVRLMARTGALAHVHKLSQVAGPGVWISDITAKTAALRPGDTFHLDTAGLVSNRALTFRVKGVYRALPHGGVTPYWVNFFQDAWPQGLDDSPPPTYVFTSRATVLGVAKRLADVGRGAPSTDIAELPVDPKGITLPAARDLDKRFVAVRRSLQTAFGAKLGCAHGQYNVTPCTAVALLSSAVALADQNVSAVSPVITLLADIGAVIALGVAAAAGVFLVRRRAAEASLLYARGEGVGAFTGRTFVETLAPTVAGGIVGFAIAYGLTSAFAPHGSLDTSTVWSGAAHAGIAVGVGLALLLAAAAYSFLRLFDTGTHTRPRWFRYLAWEVPVLAVAVYLFFDLRHGGGLSGSSGGGHPTLAVFLFPLLLVAGLAGLAARVVQVPLRSRRFGRNTTPAVFLAIRRLAAARGLLVLLTVVTAVALGACFYAEALSESLTHATVEKAYIGNGSDVQGSIQPNQSAPRNFPYPITKIEYTNQGVYVDNENNPGDLMTIDPATLASTLHWQSDWGKNPAALVKTLGDSPSSPLPVILANGATQMHTLILNDVRYPVTVVGSVRTFPEAVPDQPLVITSYSALNAAATHAHTIDPLDVPFSYLWVKGPPEAAAQALTASSVHAYYVTTVDTFLHDPNVVLATRTYGFMRTVAIASAVLVLIGVLLYLQTRQRSQVIASALTRRMGLSRWTETLSLCLELAGILAFAGITGGMVALAAAAPIVRHLDPLPLDPPTPIFVFPGSAVLVIAVALCVFTILAGAVTSWLARRTNVSEAIRVA